MNDYNVYSDQELVPILREDKPARDYAFDVLYKRYSAKLNSYCQFLCWNKEDSEQLFHRTWIKFYEYVQSGNHINNILTFLITSAKHIFLNDVKFQSRQKKKIDEFTYISEMETRIQLYRSNSEGNQLISLIHLAVDSLDDIYKEPFVLKRYHELSNEEIAKICNKSVDCIKKRITRATQLVRNMIYRYAKEPNKIEE